MFIEAPRLGEGISTCRSKDTNGKFIERTYGHVIASQRLRWEIKNMEVVEDFESRPHKAVAFLVKRDKELQELRELRMPPVKSAPRRTPVKAVLECLRIRAPPPPKGTSLQQTAVRPGPPSEFTEAEPQCWRIGAAGANPPWQWCARERALIQSMEDYLNRSEGFNVAITEQQKHLPSPEGVAGEDRQTT